jgi:uncharacterized membrane protein
MKNGLLVLVIFSLLLAVPASASVEAGIEVVVDNNAVCPCSTLSTEDFGVFIENLDSRTQEYEFELVLPDDEFWSGFIVPNETFAAGEVKSIAAFITASCWIKPGLYQVSVKSLSPVSGKSQIKKFDVEVLKCRWVEVAADEYEVCQGQEAVFDIDFVNEGDNDEKVRIIASEDWVSFEEEVFEIDAGEERTMEVTFLAPEDVDGEHEITLELASEISYVRNRQTINVDVRKCYDTEFTVTPDRQEVCPCRTADFELEIKNTGLMEDEYTIRYGDQSSEMSIASGGSGKVSLSIDVPCDKEAGEYPIDIEIESHSPASSRVVVSVIPIDQCYNVYVYSEDAVNVRPVEVGESETYEVVAVNKGRFEQEYELVLEAPYWIYMSDYETALGPGDSKSFYVYAAPEYETGAGEYPISVAAVGENEKASIGFSVVVVSEFNLTEQEEAASEEESAGEEAVEEAGDNITVESTIPTGEVVGDETEGRPWSQIVLISILAIAVVFVLVLRFVVMMK